MGKALILFRVMNTNLYFVQEVPYQWDCDEESNRYYYEEHTCPTNFVGVEEFYVHEPGRTVGQAVEIDPHGIFTVVHVEHPEKVTEDFDWRPIIERDWEAAIERSSKLGEARLIIPPKKYEYRAKTTEF